MDEKVTLMHLVETMIIEGEVLIRKKNTVET